MKALSGFWNKIYGSRGKWTLRRHLLSAVFLVGAILCTLGGTIGTTLAWYGEIRKTQLDISGSVTYVARYFESGDGSCDSKIVTGYNDDGTPIYGKKADGTSYTQADHESVDTAAAYEIKTPEQLYNLAWLQYLGYFNKENTEDDDVVYYFYLSADLDMTGYVLPPIGTQACPFMGVFDGNGHTISNLTVSNSLDYTTSDGATMQYGSLSSGDNKSEMPLQAYEEMQGDGKTDLTDVEIIGLFGVVGNYVGGATYDTSTEKAIVKNVKVTGISVVGRSSSKRCLAGLAAGYVNGTMEGVTVTGSIDSGDATTGVDYRSGEDATETTEKTTENLSYYTTVGYCVAPDTVNVTHTVSAKTVNFTSSGADSEFGGTIDMKSLHQRLVNVYGKASYATTYATVTTEYERNGPDAAFTQSSSEKEDAGSSASGTYGFKNYEEATVDGNETFTHATYSFSTTSKDSVGGGMYMYGADNLQTASGETKETSKYTTNNCPTFTIKQTKSHDGVQADIYLNVAESNGTYTITYGTDASGATAWSYVSHDHESGGSSYLVTTIEKKYYYLTLSTSGDLTVKSDDAADEDDGNPTAWKTASAWTREAVGEEFAYSCDGAYLYFDGSYDSTVGSWSGNWKVKTQDQIINIQESYMVNKVYHYLYRNNAGDGVDTYYKAVDGDRGGNLGVVKNEEMAKWYVTNNSDGSVYLSTKVDGKTKYLNANLTGTSTSYKVTSANYNISAKPIVLGDDASTATAWTRVSAGDEKTTYKFTTKATDNTVYQLNFVWTMDSSGQSRLWVVAASSEIDHTSVVRGNTSELTLTTVSSSESVDKTTYACTQTSTGSTTYVYTIETKGTSKYITNDSVFPITINTEVDGTYPSSGVYETRRQPEGENYANTGYFVSGAEDSGTPQGNLRVSKYRMSGISVSTNNSSTYTASTDKQLEILTRTAKTNKGETYSNNLGRITDTQEAYNTGHPSCSSTISTSSGYPCGTPSQLGLDPDVYNEGRTELSKMLGEGGQYIYGLHFMQSLISKNNVATFPTASINGVTHKDYQMPRNCIDFELNSTGYITFFAGTYYSGNTSFFSLHHIYRNTAGEITDIKEISKIYLVGGAYLYEYKDGSFASYSGNGEYTATNSTPSDDKMIFDMSWLTSPETGAFVNNALYYFQIPANKGEYALGSTSSHGAYLIYLDICSDPDADEESYTHTESLETVSSTVSGCPNGVGFGTVEDAAIELPFKADGSTTYVTAKAATTGEGTSDDPRKTTSVTIVKGTTGSTAVPGAVTCLYAASGVTVYNGSETADSAMSVASTTTEKYFHTITEYDGNGVESITQVDEVNDVIFAENGDFTVGSVKRNIYRTAGAGAFVTVPPTSTYSYPLQKDDVVTYSYQITTGQSGTVTIEPRFSFNKDYLDKDSTTKGTDFITVTSSSENITLENFDVKDGYPVKIKTSEDDTGIEVDGTSSVEVTKSGS